MKRTHFAFSFFSIICGFSLLANEAREEEEKKSAAPSVSLKEMNAADKKLPGELMDQIMPKLPSKEDIISLIPSEILSRSEQIPQEHIEDMSDTYLEGYIQALIDMHYYEFKILVYVADGHVYLANLPKNKLLSQSIIAFVQDIPGVKSVKVTTQFSDKILAQKEEYEVRPQIKGTWFPQQTVLFQPIIGDPWEPIYSAAYRWHNQPIGEHVIAVSFGDTFPIFRWYDVFKWKGALQIDIQAGVWSVFNMTGKNERGEFSELVNTDYLVGIPLTYAIDKWSFRLRVYHISSHLGDEFLVNNPGFPRVNPSMEAIDFFASCQIASGVRLYIGPGWVFHSDNSFPIDPLYIEYGGEFRFWGHKFYYHGLYGTFLFVANFRNWQENHWQFDVTLQLGYEWSKLQGVGRKMRIYTQYHNGYSEGQFFKDRTDYISICLSWGF
ncbi:MAG: DUF1207 domain-containing protein [Simkaniaceae bacterium]